MGNVAADLSTSLGTGAATHKTVALPETIPVKYTEEEAEYLSVRPVVRQTFRLDELLDMLLSVAGKDVARLQQILRAGTTVYNFYRYWWQGFEAHAEDLQAALQAFPDADPSRPFRGSDCTLALFEHAAAPGRALAEVRRDEGSERRWFRGASFWGRLTQLAEARAPGYRAYSYARRGDLYELEMPPDLAEQVAAEAERLAPRRLRAQLKHLQRANRILFVCPRR